MSSLASALEQLTTTKAGFERVFRMIDYDWADGTPLKGMFVYPGFTHGVADIDALVDFLDRSLFDYCVPRTEVAAVFKPGSLILVDEDAVAALREAFSDLKDRARRA